MEVNEVIEVTGSLRVTKGVEVKAWLKKSMIDGMDEVVNALKVDGTPVTIEVEVECGRSWAG